MKNRLYVVYGGLWDKDNYTFKENSSDIKKTIFKNKEKAYKYTEELIDKYLKTKSYSPNYSISDWILNTEPVLDTKFCNITNRKGEIVYSIEIVEIDMEGVII